MEPENLVIVVHPSGCLVEIRALPGAKWNGVQGIHQGALRVAVTQVAEKGKANQAILKVLAKSLGLKKSQVELASGDTSRTKQVLLRDVTPDHLRDLIRGLPARS